MRRTYYSYLPVLVAGVVFTLASTPVRAQQPAHPADEPTTPACACCGNSGGAAMNHEAGGGCCGNMAMDHAMPTTGTADQASATHDHASMVAASAQAEHANHVATTEQMDHAAMGHDMPVAAMDHKMAGGCCGDMKMDHAADAAGATAMNHEAAGGCCAGMAMDMKMDSAQPPANAAAPSAAFGATSGCSAGTATTPGTPATPSADAKAMDHGAGGCCADMANMPGGAK